MILKKCFRILLLGLVLSSQINFCAHAQGILPTPSQPFTKVGGRPSIIPGNNGPVYFPVHQEVNSLSSSYARHGEELFNEGKIKNATAKFIKALLLDGNNAFAKNYLQKIYQKSNIGDAQERYRLTYFLELVDYCQFLNGRIQNLITSNQDLIQFILQHQRDKNEIDQVKMIQAELSAHDKWLGPPEASLTAPISDELNMEKLTDALLQQKRNFLDELGSLQKMNDQLRSIRIKLIEKILTKPDPKTLQETTQYIKEIETQLTEKTKNLAHEEQKHSTVMEELNNVRKDFAGLQNRINETDKKVVGLTRDLAGMSLDLYEKEGLLTKKEERIAVLENELKDIQERFKLSQRLINQREQTPRENFSGEIYPIEKSLLSERRENDFRQFETSQAKIQKLEDNFRNLKQEYLRLKKHMDIRDREMARVYGMLDIYKWKFHETYAELQNHDERLKRKEKQLLKSKNNRSGLSLQQDNSGKKLKPQERIIFLYSNNVSTPKLYIDDINFWDRQEILDRTENSLNLLHRIQPPQFHKSGEKFLGGE